jgi:hypothetical protein
LTLDISTWLLYLKLLALGLNSQRHPTIAMLSSYLHHEHYIAASVKII